MDRPDVFIIVSPETAAIVIDPYNCLRVLKFMAEAVDQANETCGLGVVRFTRGANRLEASAECIGLAAECVALALRSHGLVVAVHPADDVAACYRVEHVGCSAGARLTPEAWNALPVITQPDASTGGSMTLRQCACGSHITMASTRVVRDANTPGVQR